MVVFDSGVLLFINLGEFLENLEPKSSFLRYNKRQYLSTVHLAEGKVKEGEAKI
jgi:hypothetical protein